VRLLSLLADVSNPKPRSATIFDHTGRDTDESRADDASAHVLRERAHGRPAHNECHWYLALSNTYRRQRWRSGGYID
jgi:hypothetical protein